MDEYTETFTTDGDIIAYRRTYQNGFGVDLKLTPAFVAGSNKQAINNYLDTCCAAVLEREGVTFDAD